MKELLKVGYGEKEGESKTFKNWLPQEEDE